MRRAIKTFLLTGLVLLGLLQGALAFSPAGPIGNNPNPSGSTGGNGDGWQQPVIGYGLPGDLVAPKVFNQFYRRNLPIQYYACDASFLTYLGSNGMAAVDSAFTILNSAFTNNPTGVTNGLDGYSASLYEFPYETRHFNYTAQTLGLWDLKSFTLGAMAEELGLADPVRYDWTLHNRYHISPGPGCPLFMQYYVVQRNYDPVATPASVAQTTPYVNNTLYSYQIVEFCTGPNPLAVSVPFSVDPLADTYSPVASFVPNIATYGAFYSGLTRDDVGELRFTMSSRAAVVESPDANSILFTTTTNIFNPTTFPSPTATNGFGTNGGFYSFDGTFGYGDYGWLIATAKTNSPAVLQALYPGLLIASSTNDLEKITNWVFTQYFTNGGYGSPFQGNTTLVTVSNPVYAYIPVYTTKFLNVFTNLFHPIQPTTTVVYQTVTVGPAIGQPPGILATNPTFAATTVNNPSGEFFVFPPFYTNACLPDFVTILATNLNGPTLTTNVLVITGTNIVTATNNSRFSSTTSVISTFTNYLYEVYPVACTTSAPPTMMYEGIQKIQFVKAPYDSESGYTWHPITNSYTLTAVTNGQTQVQYFQRIVTQPDFDFASEDLVSGPSTGTAIGGYSRNVNFDQVNSLPGGAGPGTLTSFPLNTKISFDNGGPVFLNGTFSPNDVMDGTPFFISTPGGDTVDTFYNFFFAWGSFDASTNAPTVYPDGTSVTNLQNQIFVQITPSGPLTATNGIPYNTVFSATGGGYQPTFTWSTPGVPPGLSLVSNPDSTATISGTPVQSGSFNFILVLTDSLGRSVQWTYTININP